MAENGGKWYVIHTYSGYEERVKTNLEQRIESMDVADKVFQVIVPQENEIEIKEGQRRTVPRRMFPGYLLVQMMLDEQSWYVVRNTPGVTGFVGSGNKPIPLTEEEFNNVTAQIAKGEMPSAQLRNIAHLLPESVRKAYPTLLGQDIADTMMAGDNG